MATKYTQGRDTEYACQRTLAADGYESARAGGSKGAADIIAWCPSAVRFIQCKRYTDRPGAFTKDIGQLMSMVLPPNSSAELWMKRAGVAGWIERTLIQHSFTGTMDVSTLDDLGKQERFVQPINPDQVTALAATLATAAKEQRWKSRSATGSKTAATTLVTKKPRSSTTSRATATRLASGTATPPSAPEAVTHA